jgi:hypothetical protein
MTPEAFTAFMTLLLENYSDDQHSLVIRDENGKVIGPSPWAKMQRQCLEHVPDEIAGELAQFVTMTIKTYGRVVPQMKEILDAYAELVHGPDDAEEQWALVSSGEPASEEADGIFYDLGGSFSLRQTDTVGRASIRRAFLDAYQAIRNTEKQTTRLGHDSEERIEALLLRRDFLNAYKSLSQLDHDPRQRLEAPARVLALAGKITSVED